MPGDSEISEATRARSLARSPRIPLSEEDLGSLRQLAERDPSTAFRVDVILRSARGEPITQIARATGLSRCSVWFWRKRFIDGGVHALASRTCVVLSTAQRDELAAWQKGPNQELQKRADVLLALAEGCDVSDAASKAGVGVAAAKRWRTIYRRAGAAGFLSKAALPLTVSPAERSLLLEWLENPFLARKATALLALADGADLLDAAERVDAQMQTVIRWRDRFVERGLSGVAANGLFVLSAEQKRELEHLKASASDEIVARRASVLLEVAATGNLERVAARSGISSVSVGGWKRAFQKLGVPGLEHPKGAPAAGRPERASPPVPNQPRLRADVRIDHPVNTVVSGKTTKITTAQVTIDLTKRLCSAADAIGARATAEIDWPAVRESGEKIALWLGGVLTEASADRITIKLHRAAFKVRPQLGHQAEDESLRPDDVELREA